MLHRIILVTGMSGAGKTVALKTLEDMGFEAIDNLPLSIIPILLNSAIDRPLAIGIDIRNRDFSSHSPLEKLTPILQHIHSEADAKKINPKVYTLFLDCDDEILMRRFTETRRKHPISDDRPIIDSIKKERSVMNVLKDQADVVVDTSEYSINDLRNYIKSNFSMDKKENFFVKINSFSFKKGLPRDSDLVFDMRFLKNPHYDENLRPFTGLDAKVAAYIKSDPTFGIFFPKLLDFITGLLPKYIEEGKTYLNISIGCTGGKHRSVFIANQLYNDMAEKGYNVSLNHRDITI